jgi:hypothetical protein
MQETAQAGGIKGTLRWQRQIWEHIYLKLFPEVSSTSFSPPFPTAISNVTKSYQILPSLTSLPDVI